MPPTGRFLGLDIGGTSVKAGMVGPGEKRVGASKSLPTQIQDGPEVFLDRLCDYARSFGPFDAVGVGCPGVFDPGTGALRASANLQSLEGRILVQEIAQRLNLSEDQVRVDNDANLGALAYFKIPEFIEIRTEPLPRNATGKVMKHVLEGAGENTFVEE